MQKPHLERSLGLYPATAIVIGCVVGSGIFVSAPAIARHTQSAPVLFAVWILAGVMTLFGVLTQSELAAQIPKTGGLYEYFREIYGESAGFLYGWSNFIVSGTGGISAVAFVFGIYLDQFIPLPRLSPEWEQVPLYIPWLGSIFPFADMGIKVVGSVIMIGLTWLNVRGVKVSGTLQSFSTTAKILALLGVVAIAFVFGQSKGSTANFSSVFAQTSYVTTWGFLAAFTAALSSAFWAYDGWGNGCYIAGEIKNPTRNVPLATILGALIFTALYLLLNAAFIFIFPIQDLATVPNDRVASEMARVVFGAAGSALVSILIIISTFDTTNSSILANARVYFAMAQRKLFLESAAEIHPKYHTPHWALIYQCSWAVMLLITGSYDLIISMYVFVNWSLYVLLALGVFILRWRFPDRERPFKVPFYPIIPGIFMLFSLGFVIMTVVGDVQAYQAGTQPLIKSLAGALLVLAGLPVYLMLKKRQKSL